MFWSFSVGAIGALLAAFLIAAVAKWAGFQPNHVVAVRGSHTMEATVWADSVFVQSTISSRLKHEGSTLYGGVLKFLADASDLLRHCAQRSSI